MRLKLARLGLSLKPPKLQMLKIKSIQCKKKTKQKNDEFSTTKYVLNSFEKLYFSFAVPLFRLKLRCSALNQDYVTMHGSIDFHKFMLREACVFAVSLIPSPPFTYNTSHIDLLSLYSLQSPAHSRVEEVDAENHILSQSQNQIYQQMVNKNDSHSLAP